MSNVRSPIDFFDFFETISDMKIEIFCGCSWQLAMETTEGIE